MTYVKNINKAIEEATNLNKQTSELGQLSKLLSDKVINTIFEENNKYRSRNDTLSFSSIGIGWIDKIPLAKFINPTNDCFGNTITQKVEIGDALIIDQYLSLNSIVKKSKAFIIQAKRSKNMILPVVPVYQGKAVNNSSLKELALMENWPKFDLYKTAKSKHSIISNIGLPTSSLSLPYGGFIVCPPTLKKVWPANWMCASQNKHGSSFNMTFGDLLASFFNIDNNGNSHFNVGHEFLDNNYEDQWSRLINTLIDISSTYYIPIAYKHIFGAKRYKVKEENFAIHNYLVKTLFNNKFARMSGKEIFRVLAQALNSFNLNNYFIDRGDNFINWSLSKHRMPIIIYRSIGNEPFFNDNKRD